MELEIACFITKLTMVDPDITDEELFQEVLNILVYDLQKVLTCTNISQTEGLEVAREKDRFSNQENSSNQNQNKQRTDDQKNGKEVSRVKTRTGIVKISHAPYQKIINDIRGVEQVNLFRSK